MEATSLRGCFRGAAGRRSPSHHKRHRYRTRTPDQSQRFLPAMLAVACIVLGLMSWPGTGWHSRATQPVKHAAPIRSASAASTQMVLTPQRPASLSWEHHAQTLAQLPLQPSLKTNLSRLRLTTRPVKPVVRKVVTPPSRPLTALLMPVALSQMSSPFGQRNGRMHQGVDYAAPMGTGIRAAQDGRVRFAGWQSGYGQLLVIEHAPGFETRYAHCARLRVRHGQRVRQGDVIATVGNTGHSTGPHLHFEVWRRGVAHNPAGFVKAQTLIATHERVSGQRSG